MRQYLIILMKFPRGMLLCHRGVILRTKLLCQTCMVLMKTSIEAFANNVVTKSEWNVVVMTDEELTMFNQMKVSSSS